MLAHLIKVMSSNGPALGVGDILAEYVVGDAGIPTFRLLIGSYLRSDAFSLTFEMELVGWLYLFGTCLVSRADFDTVIGGNQAPAGIGKTAAQIFSNRSTNFARSLLQPWPGCWRKTRISAWLLAIEAHIGLAVQSKHRHLPIFGGLHTRRNDPPPRTSRSCWSDRRFAQISCLPFGPEQSMPRLL